jgi:hypothetical protein
MPRCTRTGVSGGLSWVIHVCYELAWNRMQSYGSFCFERPPPIFRLGDHPLLFFFFSFFFRARLLMSTTSAPPSSPPGVVKISDSPEGKLEKKDSIGGNAAHTIVRDEDVAQQVGDGVEASYEQKSRLVNACFQHE